MSLNVSNIADLESCMNSLVSMMFLVPADKSEGVITAFCEKLAKTQSGDKKNMTRLKLLSIRFYNECKSL